MYLCSTSLASVLSLSHRNRIVIRVINTTVFKSNFQPRTTSSAVTATTVKPKLLSKKLIKQRQNNKIFLKSNFANSSLFANHPRVFSTLSKLLRGFFPSTTMASAPKFNYPVARKDETVSDEFFGTKVIDVYRWLEDPDSPETQAFAEAQNKIAQPFLEDCAEREKIKNKLSTLWNYPKYSCPARHGDYYFQSINTGLQNQSVVFKQKTLDSEPEEFFNPNKLSDDGTVALTIRSFSEDGKYFAYGLSESGSDWNKIYIRNVETGEDYDEVLGKVKFSSIAWTKDNKGFFYAYYPDADKKVDGSETNQVENQKLFYHRIGEPQEKDTLCVEFPEQPSWRTSPTVSDCGKYLILVIIRDCRDNILFYSDLEETGEINGKLKIIPIIDKFEADYDYITNTDTKFVFRTNKRAPNYRLVVIDFRSPAEDNWETLIQEDDKDVLNWAVCAHQNKIIIGYMHDVRSVLKVHALEDGKHLYDFPLDIGTVDCLSGEKKYSEIFYSFVSFLNPGTIYQYDFAKSEDPKVIRDVKLSLENFNKNEYCVEQVFYESKDKTKIPMFIFQKGKQGDEVKPCLLYGYGGFNISLQPTFSITSLMFIETFNGVVAFPNLRGGGEYGEKWHNAGRLFNKQNVFDDFQCAAEYLIANKYTEKDKLVIQGASNGGLLVGACINQRPDLFGAAIAQVGVMDMLRFHKFTIGYAWMSDYGDPDEEEHFKNVYKFSPVHNVHTPQNEKEEYPATLILTADHDDRVSPLHSLKFAAKLQDAVRNSEYQKKPILLRVYSKAGHGSGKPTAKKIEETTDILTFIYKTLKIEKINI